MGSKPTKLTSSERGQWLAGGWTPVVNGPATRATLDHQMAQAAFLTAAVRRVDFLAFFTIFFLAFFTIFLATA